MEFSTAGVVFIVYLMNQVDTWIEVMGHVTFFFCLTLVLCIALMVVNHADGKDYKESQLFKNRNKAIVVCVLLATIQACTPNKETVMQMGVAYGASEVIKSDAAAKLAQEISQISGKTAKVVEKKLDKMLEEK